MNSQIILDFVHISIESGFESYCAVEYFHWNFFMKNYKLTFYFNDFFNANLFK